MHFIIAYKHWKAKEDWMHKADTYNSYVYLRCVFYNGGLL